MKHSDFTLFEFIDHFSLYQKYGLIETASDFIGTQYNPDDGQDLKFGMIITSNYKLSLNSDRI